MSANEDGMGLTRNTLAEELDSIKGLNIDCISLDRQTHRHSATAAIAMGMAWTDTERDRVNIKEYIQQSFRLNVSHIRKHL